MVLNILKVDRGPLVNRNTNGLVMDFRNDDYRAGTEAGIVKISGKKRETSTCFN